MKAIPQTYNNLGFTLLPPANQSSWLFILVAAVVIYLVLPPLLFVIVSCIMPPAEEIPRVPILANFTSISESFSDFKILLWNSLVFFHQQLGLGFSVRHRSSLAGRTHQRALPRCCFTLHQFPHRPDGHKLMEQFRYGVSWK